MLGVWPAPPAPPVPGHSPAWPPVPILVPRACLSWGMWLLLSPLLVQPVAKLSRISVPHRQDTGTAVTQIAAGRVLSSTAPECRTYINTGSQVPPASSAGRDRRSLGKAHMQRHTHLFYRWLAPFMPLSVYSPFAPPHSLTLHGPSSDCIGPSTPPRSSSGCKILFACII